MKRPATINSNINRVSRLIQDDIRRRGLSEGEQYLTAEAASKAFGVSSPMASRAMQVLAERGVLLRRRGLGTFIGRGADVANPPAVPCVHVLIGQGRLRAGLAVGDLVEGLLGALDGHSLQTTVLSGPDAAARTRQLLSTGGAGASAAGVVLVGCSREIQEAVVERGTPGVVFGGVFATTQGLWSLDVDQFEAGRLMGAYLARAGCDRIALLTRDLWLPGDNLLLDGVNAALAEAGLNQGALVLRSVPVDAAVAEAEVEQLLSRQDAPTAVIARGRWFGERVCEAAERLGLTVGRDVALISDVSDVPDSAQLRWPKVCAEVSYRDQAARVGRLLQACMEHVTHAPRHDVIPVRLVEPAERAEDDRAA